METKVWFDNERVFLQYEGRTGSLPLADFPLLLNATDEQRKNLYFSPFGIHWPDVDEDLMFEGFFEPLRAAS